MCIRFRPGLRAGLGIWAGKQAAWPLVGSRPRTAKSKVDRARISPAVLKRMRYRRDRSLSNCLSPCPGAPWPCAGLGRRGWRGWHRLLLKDNEEMERVQTIPCPPLQFHEPTSNVSTGDHEPIGARQLVRHISFPFPSLWIREDTRREKPQVAPTTMHPSSPTDPNSRKSVGWHTTIVLDAARHPALPHASYDVHTYITNSPVLQMTGYRREIGRVMYSRVPPVAGVQRSTPETSS